MQFSSVLQQGFQFFQAVLVLRPFVVYGDVNTTDEFGVFRGDNDVFRKLFDAYGGNVLDFEFLAEAL